MTDPKDTLTLFAHWLNKRRPSVRHLGDDAPILSVADPEDARAAAYTLLSTPSVWRVRGSQEVNGMEDIEVPAFLRRDELTDSGDSGLRSTAVPVELLSAASEFRAVTRREQSEHSEQPQAYVFMRLAAADSGAHQRAQEFRIPEGTLELMPDAAASRWRAVFWADDAYLSQLKGLSLIHI